MNYTKQEFEDALRKFGQFEIINANPDCYLVAHEPKFWVTHFKTGAGMPPGVKDPGTLGKQLAAVAKAHPSTSDHRVSEIATALRAAGAELVAWRRAGTMADPIAILLFKFSDHYLTGVQTNAGTVIVGRALQWPILENSALVIIIFRYAQDNTILTKPYSPQILAQTLSNRVK